MKGAPEVVTTVQGIGKGGRGCPDARKNLCGGDKGGSDVWIGNVGADNAHWEGLGRIPPQGGPQADWMPALEREGR